MIGQWLGTQKDLDGSHLSNIYLNLEKIREGLEGSCCFFTKNYQCISFKGDIVLEKADGNNRTFIISNFKYFDDENNQLDIKKIEKDKPEIDISDILFECELDNENKNFSARWNNNTRSGVASCSLLDNDDEPIADIDENWNWFKNNMYEYMADKKYIFRGHKSNKYRLTPSFFRFNRYDLFRYYDNDIPELRHEISAITNKKYNKYDSDDFDELLNTMQHHGYPSPLLDWTFSPFIAVYFAYRNLLDRDIGEMNNKVRVYILDYEAFYNLTKIHKYKIFDPRPIVKVCILPAINNPRAIPQQSVMMVSNIKATGIYLSTLAKQNDIKLLTRIDLPASERDVVLKELHYMGITEASLFPGIVGTCETKKRINFLSQ